jgi:hypothetical protein
MARHCLQTVHDESFTGELTLGAHPDGSLTFEDGTAWVGDESVAAVIDGRYPNIAYTGVEDEPEEPDPGVVPDDQGDGEDEDGGDEDEEIAEPPVDPSEHTIDELETELDDGDFSDAELRAIRDAEESAEDRNGAVDAVDEHLSE